jgi:flagellar protein FlbD
LIYRIEEMPDTLITLTDGKTLVVTEAAQEVAQRVIEYHTVIHSNQVKT